MKKTYLIIMAAMILLMEAGCSNAPPIPLPLYSPGALESPTSIPTDNIVPPAPTPFPAETPFVSPYISLPPTT